MDSLSKGIVQALLRDMGAIHDDVESGDKAEDGPWISGRGAMFLFETRRLGFGEIDPKLAAFRN